MLTNNAGFNCNATRVIVTHAGWKQRDDLLKAIRASLRQDALTRRLLSRRARPPRRLRRRAPRGRAASARPAATSSPGRFIPGVSPETTDDIVFTTEAFCSLFAETAL